MVTKTFLKVCGISDINEVFHLGHFFDTPCSCTGAAFNWEQLLLNYLDPRWHAKTSIYGNELKYVTTYFQLIQAARDGRLDIVKNKLAKPRRDVNMKDDENSTALHYAVRFNHLEIVKHLIKKGASM